MVWYQYYIKKKKKNNPHPTPGQQAIDTILSFFDDALD